MVNNSAWVEHLSHWRAFLTERLSSIDDSDKDESEKRGERIKAMRQLAAIERVRCAAVGNPRLLIEFINPADRPAEAAECRDFFCDELNQSQQEAVNTALGGGVLSLIQGPPGTGKTTVIAEICLQLCRRNPDVRILVCSETHVAVNNLIACIAQYRDEIRIVRIQDKEQNSSADEFSPDVIINKYNEWLRENCNDGDIVDIVTQSLSNNEDKGNSLEKALAFSANIVGMTCNRVGAYDFNATSEMFDIAIIDEVCKATLPEILMPLMIARKAVLVGDPQQLPPVFCSEEIDIIRSIKNCNLQEYMYIDKLFTRSKHVTLLDTQYRMTNQIGTLIGTLFYGGKLKNWRDEEEGRRDDGILWIDYTPTQAWPPEQASREEKPRIYNHDECEIVSNVLRKLNQSAGKVIKVAVISPYRYQAKMLNDRKRTTSLDNLEVNIDTVDGFQGKECDVVIFSLTRTVGRFQFLADKRRLNVALSRARNRIYIIGKLDYAIHDPILKRISEKSRVHVCGKDFYLANEI